MTNDVKPLDVLGIHRLPGQVDDQMVLSIMYTWARGPLVRLDVVLTHLQELGYDDVSLPYDHYWEVLIPEAFDIEWSRRNWP